MLYERIVVHIRATFFRLFESFRVFYKYYFHFPFFLADTVLWMHYLLRNPFRISKNFRKNRGEKNIYAYGETPLTTLDKICRECGVLSKDTVYDLGCGRGRTSFWLTSFVRCKVIAIDHVPTFIHTANHVKKILSTSQLDFLEEDMFKIDYHKATVVYLYGTCMEDEEITRLIDKFRDLKPKTKVITVSFPLSDYCSDPIFHLAKTFSAHFPWGKTDVFLNVRSPYLR